MQVAWPGFVLAALVSACSVPPEAPPSEGAGGLAVTLEAGEGGAEDPADWRASELALEAVVPLRTEAAAVSATEGGRGPAAGLWARGSSCGPTSSTAPRSTTTSGCTRSSAPGWVNNELQNYTEHRRENARVENGAAGDRGAARLVRRPRVLVGAAQDAGRASWRYGRVEARIQLPGGWGTWPAFWMMPDDQHRGWPACGEIDIMEEVGYDPDRIHATTHAAGLQLAERAAAHGVDDRRRRRRRASTSTRWSGARTASTCSSTGKSLLLVDRTTTGATTAWPFNKPSTSSSTSRSAARGAARRASTPTSCRGGWRSTTFASTGRLRRSDILQSSMRREDARPEHLPGCSRFFEGASTAAGLACRQGVHAGALAIPAGPTYRRRPCRRRSPLPILLCLAALVDCKHRPPPLASSEVDSGVASSDPVADASQPAADDGGAGVMLAVLNSPTPISAAPKCPTRAIRPAPPDERKQSVGLGSLRKGQTLGVKGVGPKSPGCSEGWYELVTGGWVCGRYATLDSNHKELQTAPHPPLRRSPAALRLRPEPHERHADVSPPAAPPRARHLRERAARQRARPPKTARLPPRRSRPRRGRRPGT